MTKRSLAKKPLIEAIFELRWELQEAAPGVRIDPHYRILPGRIYDRLRQEYPFHEQLPTATMPDQIAAYVAQHRFRRGEDEWPLVQVGPGIITVNDTDGYEWEDFKKRITQVTDAMYEVYPGSGELVISDLQLRYINAVGFEYSTHNIFDFLKEHMDVSVVVDQRLFEHTGVGSSPVGIDLRFSYASTKPKGLIRLRFARGMKSGMEALFWETVVQSASSDVPQAKEELLVWAGNAHTLAEDWFFTLIEGELLRRFE